MKKRAIGIVITAMVLAAALLLLVACSSRPQQPETPPDIVEQEKEQSILGYMPVPDGVESYSGARVFAGDVELGVYKVMVNSSQVWNASNYQREEAGALSFSLKGRAKLKVVCNEPLVGESVVRPIAAGVQTSTDFEKNTVTFTLNSVGQYALELGGDRHRTIHIFVNDYDYDAPSDISNVITFEPGLHTHENDPRISSSNEVRLSSNTAVHIKEGAVVRAKFIADGASNIVIYGRGVIDGSAFIRDAGTNYRVTVPLEFNNCKNVTLKDVFCLDPAGWCVNFYFVENSSIENIKIISSRSNGDGISLQSCKDVEVKGCFVRSWDDSLVVKNYPKWSDRSVYGETRNIKFEDCVIWTDLAQSMEIGYETVGEVFEDVTFENVTVLHALHKPVMSIHNANNARIKRVKWENITVEDASMGLGDAGGNSELIDIRNLYSATWSDQHAVTGLGSIEDVLISNVLVIGGNNKLKITVNGCYDSRDYTVHTINGVRIEALTYKGEAIAADSKTLTLKSVAYVEGLTIKSGSATGATLKLTPKSEWEKFDENAQAKLAYDAGE